MTGPYADAQQVARPGSAATPARARPWVLIALGGAWAAGIIVLQRVDPTGAADGTAVDAAGPVMEVLRVGGLVVGWYVLVVAAAGVVARLAHARLLVRVVDSLTIGALRRALDVATGVSVVTAAVLAPMPGPAGVAGVAGADTHTPPATIRRLPDEADGPGRPLDTTMQPGPTVDATPAEEPGAPDGRAGGGADNGAGEIEPSDEIEALLDALDGHAEGPGDSAPPDGLPDDGGVAGAGTSRNAGAGSDTRPDAAAGTAAPLPATPSPSWSPSGGHAASAAHDQPGAGDGSAAASSSSPTPGSPSRPVPAPRPGSAPVASPRTHEVRPGDHFWSIAVRVLARAWTREPLVHEVAPYWRALVAANVDRLAHRDDPDLLYPGQVIVVPEPPAAPPARPP